MRSIIIDDEEIQRQNLGKLIMECCPELRVVGEADSLATGRDSINRLHPDLVFLDVEMPDGTGFDLLQSLPEIDFGVIFVTAFERYAMQAIRFSALDYLLKPVYEDDLIKAMNRLRTFRKFEYQQKLNILFDNRHKIRKIALPSQDGYSFIPVDDIVRCEADGNYTWFYLRNKEKILVTTTLKEYDDLLTPHNFFRIHYSHLVNLDAILRYKRGEGGTVILEDGSEVEVSRRRKDDFLRIMKNNIT